jgi:hypothetical protein
MWEEVRLRSPERPKGGKAAPPPTAPLAELLGQTQAMPMATQPAFHVPARPASVVALEREMPALEETLMALPQLLTDPRFVSLVSRLETELERVASFMSS